ncbi:YesL family protein [Paenibacillus sp. KN14-4R]|uniref:YesL family protein n=1 Tax=Paenibacillus sp. KN14-4R TaxID=3445773 RepID=UPI003FA06B42
MELKGFMGGAYRISEWIMRLAFTNLMWLVCSLFLPFIPIMLLYMVDPALTPEGFYVFSCMLMGIIAPFTIFPATAAMFTLIRKWVQGVDDVPMLRTFFKGYKENYLQSMLGGIIAMLATAIIYVDYKFFMSKGGSWSFLAAFFILFSIIFLATLFNFFCIVVHLKMKFFPLVKNAFLLTIAHPIASLLLLAVNGIIWYVAYLQYTFLVIFFSGSVSAFFVYWHFNRVFLKLQAKAEQNKEKEDEDEDEESISDHTQESPTH